MSTGFTKTIPGTFFLNHISCNTCRRKLISTQSPPESCVGSPLELQHCSSAQWQSHHHSLTEWVKEHLGPVVIIPETRPVMRQIFFIYHLKDSRHVSFMYYGYVLYRKQVLKLFLFNENPIEHRCYISNVRKTSSL